MIDRRIDCVHFGVCPGCVYNSAEKPPEIYLQAKEYLAAHFAIPLQFKQGASRGWRTRAKLAVRKEKSQKEKSIGLFIKGTHEVLAIPHCQVHHPLINQAVELFLELFKQSGLSAYDEATHQGDLRYLQCVVERRTNKVQLSLVINRKKGLEEWVAFCQALYKKGLFHSIWINKNAEATNTIFGKEWEKVAGADVLWEEIAGHEFAFGPSHFGQANLEMYAELIYDMQKRILPNSSLAELYAGIGIIGMSLAQESRTVKLIEIQTHAKPFFELSVQKLPPNLQQKISYKTAPAERCLDLMEGVEVAIVDPPRKGLGAGFTDKLFSQPTLKQLVYVACDWHSLERDLSYMSKKFPEWRLTEAISYLFFPGTNQIETVAYLLKE